MCGVWGYVTDRTEKSQWAVLRRIAWESQIRGKHSYGLGTSHGVRKSFNLTGLLREEEIVSWVVGHNRYCTSGDWKDHANNQPLFVKGIVLAFNGVISMKTKVEMEKDLGEPMETDNDGEMFISAVLKAQDASFLRRMKGSFAGLYRTGGKVFAARNERRPLWWFRAHDAVYVASTKDIIQRAGFKPEAEFEPGRIVELQTLL